MTLHTELLKQAGFLARKEPKKPTQVSFRRSARKMEKQSSNLLTAGEIMGRLFRYLEEFGKLRLQTRGAEDRPVARSGSSEGVST